LALAAVIWHEMAHVGGADERQARRAEGKLDSGTTRILARKALGAMPSPDGTRHVHLLTRPRAEKSVPAASDLEYALSLTDATGSEHLLTRWSDRERLFFSDWTPDGRAILGSYCNDACLTVALVIWPVTSERRLGPPRVLLEVKGRRFWQGLHSPDGRTLAFVSERADHPGRLEMGVMPADGPSAQGWTRLAADHDWPDKPRWAPDGRTLYFLSRKGTGDFNVWSISMDASTATGEPLQVTRFSSPALKIDPNMAVSEMDVRGRRLMLVMAGATGNIWVLSNANP
jgi:hypothetical protein